MKEVNVFVFPGLKKIEGIIADSFCIDTKQLYQKTRQREIVEARQFVMYYLFHYKKLRPGHIQKLTGFDRSTISHAAKTVTDLLDTNDFFFAPKAMGALQKLKDEGYILNN